MYYEDEANMNTAQKFWFNAKNFYGKSGLRTVFLAVAGAALGWFIPSGLLPAWAVVVLVLLTVLLIASAVLRGHNRNHGMDLGLTELFRLIMRFANLMIPFLLGVFAQAIF